MKKITFLITGLGMVGDETQVSNLADKFAEKGFDVTLAYILEPALVKPSNPNIKLVWLDLIIIKIKKTDIKLLSTLIICFLGFQLIPSFFSAYFIEILLGIALVDLKK
ncbi:MAG TPA: hypothetical protein DDW88_08785 [Treponema sp.]|nr:hypothetical protein [Treponema sp.]